jgi:hypothetical protein
LVEDHAPEQIRVTGVDARLDVGNRNCGAGGIEETVNVAVRCSPTATNIAVNGTAATEAGRPRLSGLALAAAVAKAPPFL